MNPGERVFLVWIMYFVIVGSIMAQTTQATKNPTDITRDIASEHFFDIFNGTSSVFYSKKFLVGMDLFGSIVFFAISPFSFVYLF